jgi:aldehyde dehydrogenase (NAD+)
MNMHFSSAHFIGNRWVPALSGQTIPVIDPSDGQPFAQLARGTADDIDTAVRAARAARETGAWGKLDAAERGRLMMKLSNAVADHADELGQIESRDTGKPLKQGRADALACARYFEFYAGAADKLTGQTLPYRNGFTVLTWREPHGVTGHIVPWNYPMQIFARSVGASLAAGNACVVKPAEDACLSLLKIAELAAAILPEGALNIVTGYGAEAGAALSAHAGIDHISFTGSTVTGALVAQSAAKNHRPVTLELGGKSPQLVFADADLDIAIPTVMNAIIQNAGQTCSAGSRVLVDDLIYDKVLAKLAERFSSLRAGPAFDDLDLGPLINQKQLHRVTSFVEDALGAGVRLAAHGKVVEHAPEGGFYALPSLLEQVGPKHRVAQEEVFGPVLAVTPFRSEEEAVSIANGTDYGLVAGIWTRDGARQLRLARALQSGQVFINNYGAGGGVELPFGGVKSSGHGREKGFEALYGFTQLKTVAIAHG